VRQTREFEGSSGVELRFEEAAEEGGGGRSVKAVIVM
jgi:hypothetical protein